MNIRDQYLAEMDDAIARLREMNEGFKQMIKENDRLISALNQPSRFTNVCERDIVNK